MKLGSDINYNTPSGPIYKKKLGQQNLMYLD